MSDERYVCGRGWCYGTCTQLYCYECDSPYNSCEGCICDIEEANEVSDDD